MNVHLLDMASDLLILPRNIVESFRHIQYDGKDPVQNHRRAWGQQGRQSQRQELLSVGLGHLQHFV